MAKAKVSAPKAAVSKVVYEKDTFQEFRSVNLTKDGLKLIIASEDNIAISVNVGLVKWLLDPVAQKARLAKAK